MRVTDFPADSMDAIAARLGESIARHDMAERRSRKLQHAVSVLARERDEIRAAYEHEASIGQAMRSHLILLLQRATE